jgi:thiamine monophosphate kinase
MGEFELLAKLRERLPPAGPRVRLGSGDDAAVTVPGGATATSVDAIVDGVHFRRAETASRSIGRKALAAALSDLAAMGSEAGEAYVVLGAPPDLAEEEFDSLLEGLLTLAADTGTTLAGDAAHLARASGVGLRIDAGSLPLAKGVAEIAAAAGRDPLELAASGGEDYELLAALPPEKLAAASTAIGEAAEAALTPIGEIIAGEGVELRLPGGGLLESRGYDHFGKRSSESP